MEYFIGMLAGIIAIVLSSLLVRQSSKTLISFRPRHSQSQTYELIKTAVHLTNNIEAYKSELNTQATKHNERHSLRVIFWDNRAYWIKDNQFYCADLVDGNVDQATTKPVDIMGMDKVQLDKMSFIVEKLTEGKADDRRSSGNS